MLSRKLAHTQNIEQAGQEVMHSYKCSNSSYMYFVGYETLHKAIWTSGEGCINIDKISKQDIPKSNMNNASPSSTFGFGCSPHTETCDNILSEYLVSHRFQSYYSKNEGGVLSYINKVK